MIHFKNKLVPVPVLTCQRHVPCRNRQRPSSLGHWVKPRKNLWKKCKGWGGGLQRSRWFKAPTKMVVGNIQQCRTVLIEHVERCRKCSMSHSEMLRAKNDVVIEQHIAGPCLDQNALQMRHKCYTSNTSNMSRVFHSWHRLDCSGFVWHLWIHTLYDTSVTLWESWELSSWQDLSLALKLGRWNFKRALRHFMVGNMRQNGIKWLHLTTHDICSSTLYSLYIYLHINMLWGAKKVGWAFCLAVQWSDFACLMGPYMSMPWIER